MIVYDRLWKKIAEDGITQYKLVSQGISHSTLTRLKKNQVIKTDTLDRLCAILNCNVEDIIEYKAD